MSRFRTFLEWAVILVPLLVIGIILYAVFTGAVFPGAEPTGLPGDRGGSFQEPLTSAQELVVNTGAWQFTLTPTHSYTLAGKMVARQEYPAALPEVFLPLDLAVVQGDLIRPDILQYFRFTMRDHSLEYSYDLPKLLGLTEEYIDEHISNNHLVVLNASLDNALRAAPIGSCMVIRGTLVNVQGISGRQTYSARTSIVRNDSYPAGCEIILVESFTPVSCGS